MKELNEKASVVVYKEDFNVILRGLYRDLKKYFRSLDSGHVRTSTGFCDLTFSHWFYKIQSRFFCRQPVKKVFLINDYVLDGKTCIDLIPFCDNRVIRLSNDNYDFLYELISSQISKHEVLLDSLDKSSQEYLRIYHKYQLLLDILYSLKGWHTDSLDYFRGVGFSI